jgi:hypothetical protein
VSRGLRLRTHANLPVTTAAALAAAVKNRLKRTQYRPGLIDGYLTATGISPHPDPESGAPRRPG